MADNMQNEAMERLKQMYSKAQPIAPNTNISNDRKREENKQQSVVEQKKPVPTIHTKKQDNLLDIFMRDKEKSLILLLIVILISEKADTTLILALMYLIL